MITPKTLKGFRDFLPKEARKRQYVIDTLRKVFESYGFEPLETPALEYEEILAGKYGDEGEKLMYKFEDKGGRQVALRYDQTVPLARVVAQHQNDLPLPFKRYQISNVWRGENPQAGRFREFLQCDIDTVGTSSLLADAEIIKIASVALEKLGFVNFKILINDRKILQTLNRSGFIMEEQLPAAFGSMDKREKIGDEGVKEDLISKGFSSEVAEAIVENALRLERNDQIKQLEEILQQMGIKKDKIRFEKMMVRGLDYYTGTIFEIKVEGYDAGSVCGGGRYDNLIGMFAGRDIPAVGCSFGFDRVIEAMDELKLFPDELSATKVLVTVFSPELFQKSLETASTLRDAGINTELYLEADVKMDKQLKYADQKGIPYVVIIGPKEAEENSATVKNMKTGEQTTVKINDVVNKLKG